MAITLTPVSRVSWPNVFKPRMNDLNGKAEYSVVALFPKGADLAVLKKMAKEAAADEWGPDEAKWPKQMRSPFRDQAERAKDVEGKTVLPAGYEAGSIFMTFKSQQKPGVVNENVEAIIDETQFYAGCYARATVNAKAYDQKGNRGISFYLNNLQKVKDGEPLSGRAKAEDDFAPIAGAGAATGGNSATALFS